MRYIVLILLFIVSKTIKAQNNAAYFSGGIKYYTCGNVSVTGNKLTVEALVKLNGSGRYSIAQFSQNIVSKHWGANDCQYLLRPNHAQLTTTNGWVYTPYQTTSDFFCDSLYHIAMVYDGSFLKFYVNGCLYSQAPATGNIAVNNYDTRIGNIAGQSPIMAEQIAGYADEVRIWSVARTESEIKQNMKDLSNPASQTGLLAYYKFEGNTLNIQGNPAFNAVPVNAPQIMPRSFDYATLGQNTYQEIAKCNSQPLKIGSKETSATYLWNTGAVTDSITVNTSGYYWVQSQKFGCTKRDSFLISIASAPVVNIGPDKQLCRGDSVFLNTTSNGNYTYSWSPASYLSNANGLTTHTFPVTNTQYILTAVNGNCIGRDTVNITVNHKPVVNVGANRQLCSGDSALINATSDGSYTYSWSPVSNLSNPNALTTHAFPSSNARYILSATNGTCTGKDTLDISVASRPVVNAGSDKQLCQGDSVFINASSNGNYTYNWSPVNNLSNANALTTYAFPFANTQYILSASNNGCIGRDTIIINSRPTPVVNLGNDTAICTGQTLILNAQNTGSTYLWNNGNTSQVNPVLASGNYIVHVLNNGCTGKDTISVQVNQRKTFSITPASPAICNGETMLLTASGADAYQWFTSSGLLNVTDSFYRANVNANRIYYVRVTDNVCKFSDTLQSQLQVLPLPNIDIVKSNNISCINPTATLSATGGVSYSWLPSQFISNTSVANPVVNPTVDTKFYVEGTGVNGCVGKDSILVTANYTNASKVYVPSAFTPNNDGLNDCFGIKNMSATDNFELSVYNRWGVCVFKTTDSGNCWDGTYRGEKQPPGTFVYQLKISGQCGDSYNKGTLVLIR